MTDENDDHNAPVLTFAEVDAILGKGPGALQLVAISGELLAIGIGGNPVVPAFQIDLEAGVVRLLVAEANVLIRAKDHPREAMRWWMAPALPGGVTPADAAVAGGHEDALRVLAAEVAADWSPTVLPLTGVTLDHARTRITAFHFAREALSDGEDELLAIAEGLLRLIDVRLAGGGTAR